MLRWTPFGLALILLTASVFACAKGGATAEEKKAIVEETIAFAKEYPDIGPAIISIEEFRGKLRVVINTGTAPLKQASFLNETAMHWYQAYPEEKKPTKNEMLQVWLWETEEKTGDEVGFFQIWADQYGEIAINSHHYRTQPVM